MKKHVMRFLYFAFLAILLFGASGCEALKAKFTRKKAKDAKVPAYYQLRKYDIKPSMELYEKHYVFWVNWQREIIAELGNNFKSDMRSIREIVSNLEDMASLLVEEEAARLEPHITKMRKVRVIIDKRNMTKANQTRSLHILERGYREVKRGFAPKKMKNNIRPDFKENIDVDE